VVMDVLQPEVGAGAEEMFLAGDVADIDATFAAVDAEFGNEHLSANLENVSDEVGTLAVGQEHEETPLASAALTESMLSTNHRSCNSNKDNC
jgi:hypothetical protein